MTDLEIRALVQERDHLLARVAELLAQRGAPVPLARIERKAELLKEYAELLPDLPAHEWKLVRVVAASKLAATSSITVGSCVAIAMKRRALFQSPALSPSRSRALISAL